MAFGDPDAPGNGPGPGGPGNGGGGEGGFQGGDRTGSEASPGFGDAGDPSPGPGEGGIGAGRGLNPGRGYFGGTVTTQEQTALGGRGRDPGWDKPGGYDYGPNGDVVVKLDDEGIPTFRVYGKAYDDAVDAQLADLRASNPFVGAVATLATRTIMGRALRFTGRTFGADIDQDGNFIGPDTRGEGGEPAVNEAPPAAEEDADEGEGTVEEATNQAYRDLLNRLQRGQGTTEWQAPDYGWIYRLSGLELPETT